MTVDQDLRAAQLAETRRRISRAAAEVVLREGPAGLTFPAVAEEAGVSLRTVYRHFANKEELVTGAVRAGAEQTASIFPARSVGLAELRSYLPVLFRELADQREYIEVQRASPAGAALRRERLQRRRDEVREVIEAEEPGLAPADRDAIASFITVSIGSSLLFDLVDHLDLSVEEAAHLAAYAVESVVERARREGGIR